MNLPLFIGLRYTGARRKSRSVSFLSGVSIAGLAVGVALLILVLSVMNGFDRELKQRILGLVPQAAIYHRDQIGDWRDLKARLEQRQDISAAAPFVQLSALVSFRHRAEAVSLWGFDPAAEAEVSLINDYVPREVQQGIGEGEALVLLGKHVAQQLGVEVGNKVMVVVPNTGADRARTPRVAYFQVAAVIESKTQLDASLALTSLRHAAQLNGTPGRVSGLRLKIRDLFAAPSIVHQATLALGPGYYSSNWTRTHGNLYQAIQMSRNLVALLMSLIVAIAAFNVVSTLVLVVIDKQGDIAILRTLGSSGRQIMAIFVAQGLAIGLLGTVAGLVAGCLLALASQDFVALVEAIFNVKFLQSDVYPLTYLPTEIRPSDVFLVGVTAVAMSLLATLYPAWKATRVEPARALRYE